MGSTSVPSGPGNGSRPGLLEPFGTVESAVALDRQDIDWINKEISSVPEPASIWLLAVGGLSLVGFLWLAPAAKGKGISTARRQGKATTSRVGQSGLSSCRGA
jgi:hypothetical protein